jgi:plasmid maintenance system killer protein
MAITSRNFPVSHVKPSYGWSDWRRRRADLAALPGNRLEALKGSRQGQYSIRINDQWRICFEWPSGASGPINVEIVDYH